ncbi:glycosyltransferase [Pistricoccus aurantiacus]|uniref:Glycosyltransferase n=1 Tax=Pistricoccus aurantiacus TaxID=1883414 RepID=A0A5B8SU18_9GAMM|nr:glycosyltransferase [Pistricoccus aurantiacus]QEA38268.1 glycosyltransferase [Pistricoccus aurantiacus]
MIGIVVPVHNEQDYLSRCLDALCAAAEHARHHLYQRKAVEIVLVLDACTDASALIAANYPVTTLEIRQANVGIARHRGAQWLLERQARWLAFTDADSVVSRDWLSAQCAIGSDAVCGGIRLEGWRKLPIIQRRRYLKHLRRSSRQRIYGANLGVSAEAYHAVGGFEPLPAHEDVHLVRALEAQGFHVAWDETPRVTTSARCEARAPEGLGALLKSLQAANWRDEGQAGSRLPTSLP